MGAMRWTGYRALASRTQRKAGRFTAKATERNGD